METKFIYKISDNQTEERVYDPATYGEMSAADAFIAGHLTDWVEAHKKQISRGKMLHLMEILESRSLGEENFKDSEQTARHIHCIMKDVEEKIKTAKNDFTDKEKMVVEYMKQGFKSEGCFDGVWYFTDEMRVGNLSQKALGGVLASLVEKGIVVCETWDGKDNMAALKEMEA